MIETPDNTAPRRDLMQCNTRWIKSYAGGPRSFEGHEIKKWTNQKGEKYKNFVTFTGFFWRLKFNHLMNMIGALESRKGLIDGPSTLRIVHSKEHQVDSDTPLWVFIELF